MLLSGRGCTGGESRGVFLDEGGEGGERGVRRGGCEADAQRCSVQCGCYKKFTKALEGKQLVYTNKIRFIQNERA